MSDLRARAAAAANGETTDPAPAAPSDSYSDPMPDVGDSGIAADPKAPAHVAWAAVMSEVQWIGKNRQTTSGAKFSYRGIDDVLNAVGPAVRKHGITVMAVRMEPEWTQIKTSSGNNMMYCRVTVTYAIIGPAGDEFPVQGVSVGESFDAGDKSTSKAMSVALRTFYTNALAIATNRPDMDPEHGKQYEIATPAPPTADEYYREIVGERVTVGRLKQIRSEIKDRPIAQEAIDEPNGESTALIDILTRVGRAKQGQQ